METLKSEVLAGLKAGKSVDTLKTEVTMSDYKDWGNYDNWLQLNVQGMAGFLQASGQVE